MNNKIAKKYLKAALKNCPLAYRMKMKTSLYESLCDYVEENPTANESELALCFGTPEQNSAEYIAALEDGDRVRLLSKNRFIKRVVVIGVAIIILIVAIGVGVMTYAVLDSEEEYYYYNTNVEEF